MLKLFMHIKKINTREVERCRNKRVAKAKMEETRYIGVVRHVEKSKT